MLNRCIFVMFCLCLQVDYNLQRRRLVAYFFSLMIMLPDFVRVFLTGWGRTHPEGEFASELREAEVPVVSASQCIKANEGLFEGISVSRSNNLCVGAGMKRPEYGCNGDSGGPLMVQTEDKKWALIGLMSWGGPECSAVTTDSYTVSTKLYMYRTWIEQMLTI